MLYDEIFSKPIEEYTDDEIRQRALELRSKAKLTKKTTRASAKAKVNSTHSSKKDKVADMLELAMTQAANRQKGNNDGNKES